MTNIITLTTDWGTSDNYIAIFKAHVLSELRNATLVDVSHEVIKYHVEMGAYLLESCYHYFPKGSIHVFDIDYLNSQQEQTYILSKQNHKNDPVFFRDYLAVKYKGHYFLAKNNGFFSMVCKENEFIEEIVKLPAIQEYSHFINFDAVPYYIHPILRLAKTGVPLTELGEPYDLQNIEVLRPRTPLIKKVDGLGDVIEFGVKYIDSYGNIITDLHKDVFEKIAQGRAHIYIYIKGMEQYSVKVVSSYSDIARNDKMVVLFNMAGYMEIASKFACLALILNINNTNVFDFRFRLSFKEKNK